MADTSEKQSSIGRLQDFYVLATDDEAVPAKEIKTIEGLYNAYLNGLPEEYKTDAAETLQNLLLNKLNAESPSNDEAVLAARKLITLAMVVNCLQDVYYSQLVLEQSYLKDLIPPMLADCERLMQQDNAKIQAQVQDLLAKAPDDLLKLRDSITDATQKIVEDLSDPKQDEDPLRDLLILSYLLPPPRKHMNVIKDIRSQIVSSGIKAGEASQAIEKQILAIITATASIIVCAPNVLPETKTVDKNLADEFLENIPYRLREEISQAQDSFVPMATDMLKFGRIAETLLDETRTIFAGPNATKPAEVVLTGNRRIDSLIEMIESSPRDEDLLLSRRCALALAHLWGDDKCVAKAQEILTKTHRDLEQEMAEIPFRNAALLDMSILQGILQDINPNTALSASGTLQKLRDVVVAQRAKSSEEKE